MLVKVGKGIELDIDIARIPGDITDPDTALGHMMYLGLRNAIMDSHAGVTEEKHGDDVDAVKRAVAEKKLQAIYAGSVGRHVERETDPVRQIALVKASQRDKAIWSKTSKKGDKYDNPRTRAAAYLDKHPELLDAAQAEYDEIQAAVAAAE